MHACDVGMHMFRVTYQKAGVKMWQFVVRRGRDSISVGYQTRRSTARMHGAAGGVV